MSKNRASTDTQAPTPAPSNEAARLLLIANAANMGSHFPGKKELFIGWQYTDETKAEIDRFMGDLRVFLAARVAW